MKSYEAKPHFPLHNRLQPQEIYVWHKIITENNWI